MYLSGRLSLRDSILTNDSVQDLALKYHMKCYTESDTTYTKNDWDFSKVNSRVQNLGCGAEDIN